MSLKGKVALVTGAASGIGRECVLNMAAKGAKVVIADLSLEKGNLVVDEIKKAGEQAMAVAMDVVDQDQVNAGIDACVKAFGGIDILVSNAGIQTLFTQLKNSLLLNGKNCSLFTLTAPS